jgi:curli biogenesis system outer membrane secretion channel CsgG
MKRTKRIIVAAAAVAALASPTAAMAGSFGGAQAGATNPTSRDGIGVCVSAGQANYAAAGYSTGDNRSVLKGGTNDMLAAGRDACNSWIQPLVASWDAPVPVTP